MQIIDKKLEDYLIAKGLDSGGNFYIFCESRFLEWRIFKVIKDLFSRNGVDLTIIRSSGDSKNNGPKTQNYGLFDDIKERTVIFSQGSFDYNTLTNNEIIFLSKSPKKGILAVKAISPGDDILQIIMGEIKPHINISLWNELVQNISEEGDIGQIMAVLEQIIDLEGAVTKEVLSKYDIRVLPDFLLFDLQKLFSGKAFSQEHVNDLLEKNDGNVFIILGYLKSVVEKLALLSKDTEADNSIIRGMHPYARKKLQELAKSPLWSKNGIYKWWDVLTLDRNLKKFSIEDDLALKQLLY